jgi:hypothetical protein
MHLFSRETLGPSRTSSTNHQRRILNKIRIYSATIENSHSEKIIRGREMHSLHGGRGQFFDAIKIRRLEKIDTKENWKPEDVNWKIGKLTHVLWRNIERKSKGKIEKKKSGVGAGGKGVRKEIWSRPFLLRGKQNYVVIVSKFPFF